MSDLDDRNAESTKQSFEEYEKRLQGLEGDIMVLKNQQQTLINLVGELTQTNNLALAKLYGTGATSGPNA